MSSQKESKPSPFSPMGIFCICLGGAIGTELFLVGKFVLHGFDWMVAFGIVFFAVLIYVSFFYDAHFAPWSGDS